MNEGSQMNISAPWCISSVARIKGDGVNYNTSLIYIDTILCQLMIILLTLSIIRVHLIGATALDS